MRRLKRILKLALVGVGVLMATGLAWSRVDSQAIPKMVDGLRGLIGPKNILRLEEMGYAVANKVDEGRFLLTGGSSQQLKVLAPPPTFQPKPNPQAFVTVYRDKGELDATVDVAVMAKKQTNLHLVCGTRQPAKGSGVIPRADRAKTVLAFSGGFQYEHDFCGLALNGQILRPMKKKAGTLIVYQDGRVVVGKWQRDFTQIKPNMSYVRQGMLLVDKGKFNAVLPYQIYALGGKYRVFRSAVGITSDGDLVYAAGNNLSAQKLAEVMIARGVVSAIHLDMNYGNVTCGLFLRNKGKLTVRPLTPRFPSAQRFLGTNSRDFFYITKTS